MSDDTPSMEGLFSPRVATVSGDPAAFDEPLPPEEQLLVAHAVEKRRREFVAGRTCARQALQRLGLGPAVIPAGDRREPVWPDGVVGSISHTRGFCGAAVARLAAVRGLGFDVEHISDMRLDLREHIASDAELDALQRILGGPRERALALAFSARETFYKCQYPLSRQWVGLRDVALRVDGGEFLVSPAFDVAGVCPGNGTVRGTYRVRGDYVLTAIELVA